MILNEEVKEKVKMSPGVGHTSEFKIRSSAKAFGILSSSLYAHPIKAIVRELSCNAYDSHVAAGKKDVPFEVHIPSKFNNNFSIKDYGVGLNHEEVTEIYTTYFESTKTDSNDYIGALGLGSKTPFSYTQNFSVTAIKDGIKRVYTSFVSDDGLPSIALMYEKETKESNGVEVSFAIEPTDVDKFITACNEVYCYFPVVPNFTGRNIEIEKIKYDFDKSFEDINVFKRKGFGVGNLDRVVMGNIAYPISHNIYKDLKLSEVGRAYGIDFYFDLGEVDIQPSREGLHYTEKTMKMIDDRINQYIEKLKEKIKSDKDSCEGNAWKEAAIIEKYKYCTSDHIKIASGEIFKDIENPFYDGFGYMKTFAVKEDIFEEMNCEIEAFYISNKSIKMKRKKDLLSHIAHNSIFIINENNKKVITKLKNYFKKYYYDNLTVFILQKKDKKEEWDLDKILKEFYYPPKDMHCKKVYNVSEYDLSDMSPVRKPKKDPINIVRFYEPSYYRDYQRKLVIHYMKSSDTINQLAGNEVLYVTMKGSQVVDCKGNNIRKYFERFYFRAKEMGFVKNIELYGVRNDQIEVAKNCSNAFTLEEHIINQLNKIQVNDFLFSRENNINQFYLSDFVNSQYYKDLSDDSYFKQIVKNIDHENKNNVRLTLLEDFINNYIGEKHFNDIKAKYDESIGIAKKYFQTYPMLKYVDNSNRHTSFYKELKDYIEAMDEIKQKEKTNV